jgi:Protein of unknown function (DUF3987)
MADPTLAFDEAADTYLATFDDCVCQVSAATRDKYNVLRVTLRLTLPSGKLLGLTEDFKLLDVQACQAFARGCTGEAALQRKVQGYLVTLADFIVTHQHSGHEDQGVFPVSLAMSEPPLMPPLPRSVVLAPEKADGAAPWLDAYCAHSQVWAPRAAREFHRAAGLWLLSTLSARRVCVHMGVEKYPMLFLALVAPSTLYTKSTTAHIVRRALESIGCRFLLTPDRQSPQALVRRMSGRVPEDWGTLDPATQEEVRQHLAFAGQRGWYYDEWGQMLQQMRRSDSVISEFHGLLKVLDDNLKEYENDTIARGLERVDQPSLALMASATITDLAPYMRAGGPWWQDGFWARFAFITPYADEEPSLAPFPLGLNTLPSALVVALRDWHDRLGMPQAHIEQVRDARGHPSGAWKLTRTPFFPHVLPLAPGVHEAFQAYNHALLTLIITGTVSKDLAGCYGRFHEKALRIAILLASVQDAPAITLEHWAYAQMVTEAWRGMLHQLLASAAAAEPLSQEETWELRIEALLNERGAMSARDFQRYLFRCTSRDLQRLLGAMTSVGRIVALPKGRTTVYVLPLDAPPQGHEDDQDDVPF